MPRGYKTFSMLNSAELENLNAHKYEKKKKKKKTVSFFQSQINLECFFHAHKCLNANICWHFKIYEQEKLHVELS